MRPRVPRPCRWARSRLLAFLCVFCSLLLSRGLAEGVQSAWVLQAYHLYQPSDAAGSTWSNPTSNTITPFSDMDLMSPTCALDAAWESASTAKRMPLAATTQSVYVNITDSLTIAAPINRNSMWEATDIESSAKADAIARSERRECEPTQLNSIGTLNLGVFSLEQTGVQGSAAMLVPDFGGGLDAMELIPPTDLSDKVEREFEVSIFVGDFSRLLCITAAVYPTLEVVGNLSEAMAVWVPSSVSPACALRLIPPMTDALGIGISEEDFLSEWPPTREQQCHLNEVNKFMFRFKPALASGKVPSYCVCADTLENTGGSDTCSQRRVRCEVFLDVQATTWYAASLSNNTAFASLKLAAAITEIPTEAAGGGATSSHIIPVAATTQHSHLAAAWCTGAEVGHAFWFSDAASCEPSVEKEWVKLSKATKRKSYVIQESALLFLAAVALALMSGFSSSRLISKACLYWSRPVENS